MKKVLAYLLTLVLVLSTGAISAAREKKNLSSHTIINRGEVMAGAGILYANVNSGNSEFLLLANNLDASGKFFRIAPSVSVAYRDNATIGLRGSFNAAVASVENVNLNLLDKDLGIDLKDIGCAVKAYGVSLYHRNYFGLEKSGTVGLFCEFRLGYTHTRLDTASDSFNTLQQMNLCFAPGAILFVLPFVSLEASIGIADVTYTISDVRQNDAPVGNSKKIKAGVSLNLLNCNFGVTYHF